MFIRHNKTEIIVEFIRLQNESGFYRTFLHFNLFVLFHLNETQFIILQLPK